MPWWAWILTYLAFVALFIRVWSRRYVKPDWEQALDDEEQAAWLRDLQTKRDARAADRKEAATE
jgi:hypothetical protein